MEMAGITRFNLEYQDEHSIYHGFSFFFFSAGERGGNVADTNYSGRAIWLEKEEKRNKIQ